MATFDGTTVGSTPAVKGTTAAGSNVPPVQGFATDGNGVYGQTAVGSYGAVAGVNSAQYGFGVYGEASASAGAGVKGLASGYVGYGVFGEATGASGRGVWGTASDANGTGVFGYVTANSSTAYAVYGYANYATAYAGYFAGKVNVTTSITAASVTAGTKSFLIDHPLDPENRVLEHSCVESSERKNVYDGVGTADSAGELVVEMPAYFDALNEDFRYQLTAVGKPAPNLHVKHELEQGRFVIAGAAPGQKICWQVTGNRRDAFARANPLRVEEDKCADERGFYLHPEAHGQPAERGIHAKRKLSPSAPPAK